MAATDQQRDDPIADEVKRAREHPDRSSLPTSDGLTPGAAETPSADVRIGHSEREQVTPEATSTPSLGAPPRQTERPDHRSSQLDGAPDEEEEA